MWELILELYSPPRLFRTLLFSSKALYQRPTFIKCPRMLSADVKWHGLVKHIAAFKECEVLLIILLCHLVTEFKFHSHTEYPRIHKLITVWFPWNDRHIPSRTLEVLHMLTYASNYFISKYTVYRCNHSRVLHNPHLILPHADNKDSNDAIQWLEELQDAYIAQDT